MPQSYEIEVQMNYDKAVSNMKDFEAHLVKEQMNLENLNKAIEGSGRDIKGWVAYIKESTKELEGADVAYRKYLRTIEKGNALKSKETALLEKTLAIYDKNYAKTLKLQKATSDLNRVKEAGMITDKQMVVLMNSYTASLNKQSNALSTLKSKHDPLHAAREKYKKQEAELKVLLESNTISQKKYNETLARYRSQLAKTLVSTNNSINSKKKERIELEKLAMKYDHLYAAEKRYTQAKKDLIRLQKAGIITGSQYTKMLQKQALILSTLKGNAGGLINRFGQMTTAFGELTYASKISTAWVSALHKAWKLFFAVMAAQTIARWATDFAKTGENIELMERKLTHFTGEANSLAKVSESAYRVGLDFEILNKTLTRFAITTKGAFDIDTMLKWTETLVKAGRASGATTQELSSGLLQLSQAMSAGRLMGDEYRSISENMPMLKQAIESVFEEMGMGNESLKELAREGKITTDVLIKSFGKLGVKVDAMGDIWDTIDASISRFIVQWQLLVYQMRKDGTVFKDIVNSLASSVKIVREFFFGSLSEQTEKLILSGEDFNTVIAKSNVVLSEVNTTVEKTNSLFDGAITSIFGAENAMASANGTFEETEAKVSMLNVSLQLLGSLIVGGLIKKIIVGTSSLIGLTKALRMAGIISTTSGVAIEATSTKAGIASKIFTKLKDSLSSAQLAGGSKFVGPMTDSAKAVSKLGAVAKFAKINLIALATTGLYQAYSWASKFNEEAEKFGGSDFWGRLWMSDAEEAKIQDSKAQYASLQQIKKDDLAEEKRLLEEKKSLNNFYKSYADKTFDELVANTKIYASAWRKNQNMVKELNRALLEVIQMKSDGTISAEEYAIAFGILSGKMNEASIASTLFAKLTKDQAKVITNSYKNITDKINDFSTETDNLYSGKLNKNLKEYVDSVSAVSKEIEELKTSSKDAIDPEFFDELKKKRVEALQTKYFNTGITANKKPKEEKEINKLIVAEKKLAELRKAGVGGVQLEEAIKQVEKYNGVEKARKDAIERTKKETIAYNEALDFNLRHLQDANPALSEYVLKVNELNQQKKSGAKTQEEYNTALEREKIILSEGTNAQLESLKVNYDAVYAATKDNALAVKELNELYLAGGISVEAYGREMLGARKALIAIKAETGNLEAVMEDSMYNVTDDMGANMKDTFREVLDGNGDAFENFTERMENSFKDMLAEMIYQALINPIMLNIQESFNPQQITSSSGGGGMFGGIANAIGGLFGGSSVGSMIAGQTGFTGGAEGILSGAEFLNFAKGGAFTNGVQAFANGGIVNGPTLFPMADGAGLMGEAGPEAIMPLTRKNGKLGVESSGKATNNINITINVQGVNENQEAIRRSAGQVAQAAGNATQRAMRRNG